jgi:broad specificity phosphatase PhoE
VTLLHLVRHGRASAGWDVDPDPGLDDVGVAQAEATAAVLAALEPRPIVSSPLRRCRETAGRLATKWNGASVTIEPAVTEIPSPDGIPMGERVPWLRAAMAGTWAELGPRYVSFRDGVIDWLAARDEPTVVFSHFIAINAVIGRCLGDDRLVIDSLDNASVTVVEIDADRRLRLVERGRQADTLIR